MESARGAEADITGWNRDQARRQLVNKLLALVDDRLNNFTPAKKPVGWYTDAAGRRKRIYVTQATPYQRLLRSRALSPAQQVELANHQDGFELAGTAAQSGRCQQRLIFLAAEKSRNLQDMTATSLPDPHGIKNRKKTS